MRSRVVSVILASIIIFTGTVTAVERHVPSEYSTIQAAIDTSSNGDVVIIAPGIYTGTGNKNITYLGKAITVRSADPYDQSVVESTVIDGEGEIGGEWDNTGFIFNSGEGPDSILSGLTITNCVGGDGGGIHSTSNPTVSKCKFINNTAIADGGGIYNTGNMIIADCVFINNGTVILLTGGIYNEGSIDVSNCTFINNYGVTLYNQT